MKIIGLTLTPNLQSIEAAFGDLFHSILWFRTADREATGVDDGYVCEVLSKQNPDMVLAFGRIVFDVVSRHGVMTMQGPSLTALNADELLRGFADNVRSAINRGIPKEELRVMGYGPVGQMEMEP